MSAEQLVRKVSTYPEVKQVVYLDKAQAMVLFSERYPGLEEDPSFSKDILPESLQIHLQAESLTENSLVEVAEKLKGFSEVDEVRYDAQLVQKIEYNLRKIELIFGILVLLLAFISIVLIHYSIKSSLFSKRFLIRTMLLVGAQKLFIYRPYLEDFLKVGVISAVFANLTLFIFIFVLKNNYPPLQNVFESMIIFKVFLSVIGLAISLSLFSSWSALRRYVHLSADEIF